MSADRLIETPSKKWRLYNRPNGSHYVLSPYGTQIEIEDAASPLFFACARGLELLPNELSRICDICPITEPVGPESP